MLLHFYACRNNGLHQWGGGRGVPQRHTKNHPLRKRKKWEGAKKQNFY